MGSKSYSVTEEVNKTYADYATVDGSQTKLVTDFRNVNVGGDLALSVLDGGAISGAFDFAGQNTAALERLTESTLRTIQDAGQRETETALFALNKATTLSGADLSTADLIKWGGIAIALAVVVFALKGK